MATSRLFRRAVLKRFLFGILAVSLLPVMFGSIGFAETATDETEAQEKQTHDFVDFLKQGKLSLNLRYRFEYVTDQTTAETGKDARASTLRTAFGYRSRPFHGFAGFIEFENVSVPGYSDTFNNRGAGHLWNGVDDRPAVADVKLTEVNQVYLDLTALPDTVIHAGREEIVLDNARFIGNVGWRQNHQSFDMVSAVNTSIPRTTFTYIHLFKARRIFGDSKPMNTNLLNVSVQVVRELRFTAYAYLLDYCNPEDFGLTANSFGFRVSGAKTVHKGWNALYDVEYARQADGGNNPNTVEENYYRLEGGASRGDYFNFKVGHEVLGGSPDTGQFNTPLATLHPWNGWADKFPTTPADGLEDTYFSIGGNPKPFGLQAAFHRFRSETGDTDYGKEMDLLVTYRSPWEQVFGFKAAFYRADLFSEDTDKIMIYTSYGF